MVLTIKNAAEVSAYRTQIESAASQVIGALRSEAKPIDALRRMKFEKIGTHPIEPRSLNVIEQINQTFTYLVALSATERLLEWHPKAGGFLLAPGAHAALKFDIESVEPELVAAETFAAVGPGNNQKLARDLEKLSTSSHHHRYAFFYSPNFGPGRIERLEGGLGVEVHCVSI